MTAGSSSRCQGRRATRSWLVPDYDPRVNDWLEGKQDCQDWSALSPPLSRAGPRDSRPSTPLNWRRAERCVVVVGSEERECDVRAPSGHAENLWYQAAKWGVKRFARRAAATRRCVSATIVSRESGDGSWEVVSRQSPALSPYVRLLRGYGLVTDDWWLVTSTIRSASRPG